MPQDLIFVPSDGGPELPVTLPTSWADVSLADYLRLHTDDGVTVLEVLTGLDADTLGRLVADDAVYLATALAFAADTEPLAELVPTPGLLAVGASPYGLLVMATEYIKGLPENAPGLQAAPYLYALYRCQQIYGKITDAKIAAIEAGVLAEPVTRVYADVAFFLKSYRLAISGMRPAPKTKSSPKKTKPKRDWKALVKGLVRSSRSTPPPKACG